LCSGAANHESTGMMLRSTLYLLAKKWADWAREASAADYRWRARRGLLLMIRSTQSGTISHGDLPDMNPNFTTRRTISI
jgi:hypothetical protein